MSTPRKGLLTLVGELLAPTRQWTVADSQFSCNPAHWFAAALDELHRFHFELAGVGLLLLGYTPSFDRVVYSTFPYSTKPGQDHFWQKMSRANLVPSAKDVA